jgi:hypothetical protein
LYKESLSNVRLLLYIKLNNSGNPSVTLFRDSTVEIFTLKMITESLPVMVKKLYKKTVRKFLPIATASNEGWTLHLDQSQKARLDESVNLHFKNFGNFKET